MLSTLFEQRADIERLCRQYQVERLTLFGSALRDDFDPTESDVDLLVQFADMEPAALADAYFGLKEALEQLLGREVDLITERGLRNPYLRNAIDRQNAELYAA